LSGCRAKDIVIAGLVAYCFWAGAVFYSRLPDTFLYPLDSCAFK